MKAIILSAGQGRRLQVHTSSRPKCLLPLHGRSVLEWQLRSLAYAGVREVSVVVGFAADQVRAHLKTCRPFGLRVNAIYNPLWDRADNLTSCIEAFGEMNNDFLLINGDTLFEPAIIGRLLASTHPAVSMAIVEKGSYDADDMKVARDGDYVLQVNKGLPTDSIDAEAIGLTFYRGLAPQMFREAIQEVARNTDAYKQYYLAAVALLARRRLVRSVAMNRLAWAEIDYPEDIPPAAAVAGIIESRLSTPWISNVQLQPTPRWTTPPTRSELIYEDAPLRSLR